MTALYITQNDSKPMHVAARMADTIIDCLERTGYCRILDMEAKGFSRDDLARYWPDAWKIVEERRPRPVQRLH